MPWHRLSWEKPDRCWPWQRGQCEAELRHLLWPHGMLQWSRQRECRCNHAGQTGMGGGKVLGRKLGAISRTCVAQMGAYCLRIIVIMISMTMRLHFGLAVTRVP